jgi:hypothetical protein
MLTVQKTAMYFLLQGMPAAGGMGKPAGAGWVGAPQQQPVGGAATTFAGAGGGDSCQSAVFDVLQKCNGDSGLHINEVSLEGRGGCHGAVQQRRLAGLHADSGVCTACTGGMKHKVDGSSGV